MISHISAAAFYDLGEFTPSILDLSVPPSFANKTDVPVRIKLHKTEVSGAARSYHEGGFCLTTPLQTIVDLFYDERIEPAALKIAFRDAVGRGLISAYEIESTALPEKVKYHLQLWSSETL